MPVGATIGVAAIGAGGSMLAGSKNSKAIGKASDAEAAANREAVAAQKEARNQNVQLQTPFYNTGTAAMGQMNALLGLQVPNTPAAAPVTGTASNPYTAQDINAMWHDGIPGNARAAVNAQRYSMAPPVAEASTAGTVTAQQSATDPRAAAEAAYNQFKGYTGYTSRLAEGNNALNAGYAASGTLQSGDALKAFARYNQDFASNEFGQYANLLGGQQQLGAGAANALSGVNTNYANAASNLAISNGQNQANTAVARANNTNGMIQGVGSAITGALGGMGGGSSYRFGG